MIIDRTVTPSDLLPAVHALWRRSAETIGALHETWNWKDGAPVYTARGRYTARGWTDWTEGFHYGSALLQYDAIGEDRFLTIGRTGALRRMPAHVTHFGVHDHGFNNISTYGNLLRLIGEGRADPLDADVCRLALRCSGAVQAARWTPVRWDRTDGPPVPMGFVHSFNGPHSLFVDTIRSMRALAVAHALGQELLGEQDARTSLLDRLCAHAAATAVWSVYYGEGRDAYDVPGRTAHECLFNPVNGSYRCPSTQQGYSPFTTWTRGLAWAICGFAELLEWFDARPQLKTSDGVAWAEPYLWRGATAAAEFYIAHTATDGVPYWDTGAPGLAQLGDWRARPAEPCNDHEPVDSSAAAIAAQGLLRLGSVAGQRGEAEAASRWTRAGLTVARTLFASPYLSDDPGHQGLILHAIYHRPNGWDYVPEGSSIPRGEACLWGDYHARELALMILRMAEGTPWPRFFEIPDGS